MLCIFSKHVSGLNEVMISVVIIYSTPVNMYM